MIKLLDILLEGKQVGTIYHYTTVDGLQGILKDGYLKPSPARQEQLSYVSFSRNKALGSTLGPSKTQVRISIDGDKLSNKYKLLPYTQLEPETEKDKENWNKSFSKTSSESEVIIPSKKYNNKIEIIPYINNIDIIITGRWKDPLKNNLEDAINIFKTNLKITFDLIKKYNIPVNFYLKDKENLKKYFTHWKGR
jgi:hypothetical protein